MCTGRRAAVHAVHAELRSDGVAPLGSLGHARPQGVGAKQQEQHAAAAGGQGGEAAGGVVRSGDCGDMLGYPTQCSWRTRLHGPRPLPPTPMPTPNPSPLTQALTDTPPQCSPRDWPGHHRHHHHRGHHKEETMRSRSPPTRNTTPHHSCSTPVPLLFHSCSTPVHHQTSATTPTTALTSRRPCARRCAPPGACRPAPPRLRTAVAAAAAHSE